jgi:hypothetical protein
MGASRATRLAIRTGTDGIPQVLAREALIYVIPAWINDATPLA